MTGPISETRIGSQPKISRPACDEPLGLLVGLDVLDDPAVGAVGLLGAQELDHPLERAAGRAHALDRA